MEADETGMLGALLALPWPPFLFNSNVSRFETNHHNLQTWAKALRPPGKP